MDKEIVYISIGCIVVGFQFSNKRFRNAIVKRYGGFTITNAEDPLVIDCTSSRKKKIGSGQQVQLRTTETGVWCAERFDFKCTWNTRKGSVKVLQSLYSFDAMFRVLIATTLLSYGGILVHSSAVVHNNSAYVFAGPSGSGKTTIALNSRSGRVLNDEIVAFSIDGSGDVTVTGTPFWGEMVTGPACRKHYSLNSIFYLKKDRHQYREPINQSSAIAKFMRCVCIFGNSNEESTRSLDICTHIISRVHYSILHFKRKTFNWEAIDSYV